MEGFNELHHKLREAHEREVESWQEKVQELSNKKGCDIKRMEELFNRNQQMREQQRLLTENIKSLENRLRAGLCDRCTVTQEVAKRRQQEYEASQIQSLQHISILATEMNNTKKENKRLREEVRSLRGVLDGQSEHSSSSTTPEGKPARSPDLSPSAEPVALVTTATSKADMQPGGGAVAVKTESDQRTEENMSERRQMRVWNRNNFESYKPLHLYPDMPAAWKTEQSLTRRVTAERRTQNVEGVERRSPISPSMPPHLLLLKNLAASSPSAAAPAAGGGEANKLQGGRHLLHAPVPCRPRPFKSSHAPPPWTLSGGGEASDWVGVTTTNTNTNTNTAAAAASSPKPGPALLPRFPNLIPTSQHAVAAAAANHHGTSQQHHHHHHGPARRQVVSFHGGWPKQSPPPPPPPPPQPSPLQSKEPSLVFRVMRGLSSSSSPGGEQQQQNSCGGPTAKAPMHQQERKEPPAAQWRPAAPAPAPAPAAPQTETHATYGGGGAAVLREANNDAPLDLSERGMRSKPNASPKDDDDDEPILVSEGERDEGAAAGSSSGGDANKAHSPCAPPPSSGQQQELHPSGYKTDEDTRVISEETNGSADQSNGKKVPVLTISLRPVVLLESLNAGLLKQESSSSNGKSPSTADPGSSSEEQERGESPGTESSQGSKRKRRRPDTDTDRDSDADVLQQERKMKVTVGPQETSPNYTGQA